MEIKESERREVDNCLPKGNQLRFKDNSQKILFYLA